MTFSLVARCRETGMFGVAIASSSPAVAARCSHARAGVGAAASQNVTDPSLGPLALDFMEQGLSARSCLSEVSLAARHLEYRQLLLVDRNGETTIHSGTRSLGVWAEAEGEGVAAAGNLLANPVIPRRMVEAFEVASGHLGARLIEALRAGLAAGGEAGPIHSAGVKLVDKVSWPVADLRCDWTNDNPIEAVADLWGIYEPQLIAYVERALNPDQAPSYRVPGDDDA